NLRVIKKTGPRDTVMDHRWRGLTPDRLPPDLQRGHPHTRGAPAASKPTSAPWHAAQAVPAGVDRVVSNNSFLPSSLFGGKVPCADAPATTNNKEGCGCERGCEDGFATHTNSSLVETDI